MSHIAEDLTITIKLLSHFSFILQCPTLTLRQKQTARLNSLRPNRKHPGREPTRVKDKSHVALCGEKKKKKKEELTSYSQCHHGERSRVAPEKVRNVEPHRFGAAFEQRHALFALFTSRARRPRFIERLEVLSAILTYVLKHSLMAPFPNGCEKPRQTGVKNLQNFQAFRQK